MKFQLIKNLKFAKSVLPFLQENGYKEVPNKLNGGDDDFLLIDVDFRRFTWLENGFVPSYDDLFILGSKNKTLSDCINFGYYNTAGLMDAPNKAQSILHEFDFLFEKVDNLPQDERKEVLLRIEEVTRNRINELS